MVGPSDRSESGDCDVPEADAVRLSEAAPDLYELVEAIRGNVRPIAVDALFYLKNKVCHQGMAVSSGTPLVLPILITLLSCSHLAVRVELFELVERIAKASTAWRRAAGEAGAAYADNYRERVNWEVAVDKIFAESLPRLEALRGDSNSAICRIANELMRVIQN